MRAPLLLARTCIRQSSQPVRQHGLRTFAFNHSSRQSYTSFLHHARPFFRHPPPPIKNGRALLWATAALSPAAFIELSENKNGEEDDGKTGEQHMLEASRAELAEQAPFWVGSSTRVRRSIWRFFDTYIVEPIATGLRFLHLVIIFVPVIATIPMIWIGARSDKRDGERWGTVWWYGFLVNSMERAGAAFIKVRTQEIHHSPHVLIQHHHSLANGPLQEQTSSLPNSATSCHLSTPTLLHTVCTLPRKPLNEHSA